MGPGAARSLVTIGLLGALGSWVALGIVADIGASMPPATDGSLLVGFGATGWVVGPLLVLFGGQSLDAAVVGPSRIRREAPGVLSGVVGALLLGFLFAIVVTAVVGALGCSRPPEGCPPGENCSLPAAVPSCATSMDGVAVAAVDFGIVGLAPVVASGCLALGAGRRPGTVP